MRLNKEHREALESFAYRIVTGDPKLVKASAAAYAKAEALVHAGFAKKYPAADLEVLKKYGLTTVDDCVRVKHSEELSSFDEFKFGKGTGPVVPRNESCRHNRPVFYFGDKCGAAVIEANKAKATLADDIANRLGAYESLIASSSTDEQLLKVWPEAASEINKFKDNLPAALSESAIALIAADSAARVKAAAA